MRRAQTRERIGEKLRIGTRHPGGVWHIGHTGQQLMQHHINTGHILCVERAEIVSRPDPQPHVSVHVLHHVTDIFHAVRTAPVSQYEAKTFTVQPGDRVHIGLPQPGAVPVVCEPQRRQHRLQLIRRAAKCLREQPG